jgi:hypothetical protein
MKKLLAVFVAVLVVIALPSLGGERPVCVVPLNDGGIAARSTGDFIGVVTLDGVRCPASRLQTDGGLLALDGGPYLEPGRAPDGGYFRLSDAGIAFPDGGPLLIADGGTFALLSGCVTCDLRGAASVALQCNDPVYYSEQWGGTVTNNRDVGVREPSAATTNGILVDFDINPDPYRIDFRDAIPAGQTRTLSIKPVSASASNRCVISTIKRAVP